MPAQESCSGGGTRAAAFSYGVLEFLRRTEIVAPNGAKFRLLDSIDVITGVSGGSFTALAYGLPSGRGTTVNRLGMRAMVLAGVVLLRVCTMSIRTRMGTA